MDSTQLDSSLACVGAAASVFLCTKGEAAAEASVTATAVAKAWAKVVTNIDAYCVSTGKASACSLAKSSIEAAATAQAQAFAEAWAATEGDCVCKVDVAIAAKAIGSVLVKATLDVFAKFCVAGAPPVLLHTP